MKFNRFLIILALVFGIGGCSAVGRVDLLKPNLADTDWKDTTSKGSSYKFQNEGVSVFIFPVDAGGGLITIGPPLLPLIPIPGLVTSVSNDLSFYFSIESPSEETSIDLSRIALKLPDGITLVPLEITTWQSSSPDDACIPQPRTNRHFHILMPVLIPGAHVCIEHRTDSKSIPLQQFVIDKTTRYFEARFYKPKTKIEECIIELGAIDVNGKHADLPPVILIKTSVYGYQPFILPLPR